MFGIKKQYKKKVLGQSSNKKTCNCAKSLELETKLVKCEFHSSNLNGIATKTNGAIWKSSHFKLHAMKKSGPCELNFWNCTLHFWLIRFGHWSMEWKKALQLRRKQIHSIRSISTRLTQKLSGILLHINSTQVFN